MLSLGVSFISGPQDVVSCFQSRKASLSTWLRFACGVSHWSRASAIHGGPEEDLNSLSYGAITNRTVRDVTGRGRSLAFALAASVPVRLRDLPKFFMVALIAQPLGDQLQATPENVEASSICLHGDCHGGCGRKQEPIRKGAQ